MRLANRKLDFWELRSGEASHKAHPDTFWIPPLADRQNLRRGQAAKLIFEIDAQREDGSREEAAERMWVIVAERVGDVYIGILDNQPAFVEAEGEFYLRRGAEVPFRAEHVVDIDDPPPDYAATRLREEPVGRWLRT